MGKQKQFTYEMVKYHKLQFLVGQFARGRGREFNKFKANEKFSLKTSAGTEKREIKDQPVEKSED